MRLLRFRDRARAEFRLRGSVRRLMRAARSGTDQVVVFRDDLFVALAVLQFSSAKKGDAFAEVGRGK